VSAAAPPPAGDVRTIGGLMLNGVGDIVCVTPALEALKARYPGARITMMVRPHLRELVDGLPTVHDVIPFGNRGLGDRIAFLREIRRRRFDLWVDFHTPTFNTVHSNTRHFLRNAFLMRWAAPRYRRAYASKPLAHHLTHPLAVPSDDALKGLNVARLSLDLAWPEPGAPLTKRFPLTEADRTWAREALAPFPAPRVGLYFGTRQPAKSWPEAASDELVRRLLARVPAVSLVVVGDASDAERAARLVAALPAPDRARVADLTGRTGFARTAALLAAVDVVVSSDSGPMHIADAVGVPMVAIFSTHNHPGVWSPVNPRSIMIYHEIECGPCFLPVCPVGNRCMKNITPDEVYDALERKLAAG
jgi:ADP-heptose:LPS heptosyltransferase